MNKIRITVKRTATAIVTATATVNARDQLCDKVIPTSEIGMESAISKSESVISNALNL